MNTTFEAAAEVPTELASYHYQPQPVARTARPFEQRWLIGTVVMASCVGVVLSSPLIVAAPVLLAGAWRHRSKRRRGRDYQRRLAAEIPLFVDELIQRLKGGGSLNAALREAVGSLQRHDTGPTPLARIMAPLDARLSVGVGLSRALRFVDQNASPGIVLLVGTLQMLVRRGGPALPSLERLGDTLGSSQALDAEVQTQAAQARASASVLVALPALFIGLVTALDGDMARFYLFHPLGGVCLLAAAGLAYVSWWWMDAVIGQKR